MVSCPLGGAAVFAFRFFHTHFRRHVGSTWNSDSRVANHWQFAPLVAVPNGAIQQEVVGGGPTLVRCGVPGLLNIQRP